MSALTHQRAHAALCESSLALDIFIGDVGMTLVEYQGVEMMMWGGP